MRKKKVGKATDLDTSVEGEHVIEAGIVKRIHVNQHHIKRNEKERDSDLPVFTVKTSRGNFKGHSVDILEASSLSQDRGKLPCGARVWVETSAAVIIRWRPFSIE